MWGQVCGELASGDRPILLALFLAGLGSSVTHCLSMCSGFVLGQIKAVGGRSAMARLLIPYHAGRLTTYGLLGIAAGSGFQFISGWAGFPLLRHLLLAIVAVLFLALFADRLLRRVGVTLPLRLPGGCDLRALQRLRAQSSDLSRYALGVSLGFLPCPMVFAALVAVAATANPITGGLGLLLFGLGTTPALIGLGFAGGNLLISSPKLQDSLMLVALGVNGLILLSVAAG
jgi:sulfite exporter TauE/SafE